MLEGKPGDSIVEMPSLSPGDRIRLRKLLSVLIFFLITGIGVFYYNRHKEDFQLITTVSVSALVILFFLRLTLILCYGVQVKILTDHYNLDLGFPQWFGLSRLTNFTNLLLPLGGGTSVKAVYLKKFHNLRYSSFIASNAIGSMIKILVISLFSSILLFFLGGRSGMLLLTITGAVFTGTLTFLFLAHRIQRYLPRSLGYLKTIIEEWMLIRKDHKTIMKLILLNCFIFIIFSLEIYTAYRVFSIKVSPVPSGVIASFTMFSGVLHLVPAGLGVTEAVFLAISTVCSLGINAGLHAALLRRIIGTVLTLVFVPFFAHKLL